MPAAPVTLFPFFAASIPAAYILLDSGSVDVDSNPPSTEPFSPNGAAIDLLAAVSYLQPR